MQFGLTHNKYPLDTWFAKTVKAKRKICISQTVCQLFKGPKLDTKQHKMDLCKKEFLLLAQFITGSFLKVTVPEDYDKYVGSQGWKKL